MNSNQSKNLTQKQQELIKRLESIRNNRESTNKEANETDKSKSSASTQRRNENTQQKRPIPTRSKKKVDNTRTRTASQKKVTRSSTKPPVTVEPRVEYKPIFVEPQKRVQHPKVAIKKKEDEQHYVKQLSDGKKLSQAIILSEILDKPVALRRRS